MAGRDLMVRIRADVTDFQNKMRVAKQGITDFNNELTKSSAKRQAINDVGTAFGRMGLVAAAGLGASVKAAVDWESAWAGVMKTVDASPAQFAKLEAGLRQMARTMPATHAEIAAVAEAAGQLGVAREDILDFTKVMVQLGETTNLTADEAATSIAQMTNIMQTSPGDIDNLAATLVELGNNGASTERDIIQMAQNIAGAGKIVGASEGEILALANALASVGIEAEAGGSSVSKILTDMSKAAQTGSPDLAVWAETAEKGGLAVGTFTDVMAESPVVAFDAFTKGLGEINEEGGNVFAVLDSVGQTDIRVNRALLGMAGAGDLLSESLALQGEAWTDNTALTDEYAKRSNTAAAKTQVAWNGIKDNAISIGASALPVIKDMSDAVAELTGWFSDLPKPVQAATGKALALAAVLGGSVFVGSRVITGIAGMRRTFADLGVSLADTNKKALALRGGVGLAGLALLTFSDEIGNKTTPAMSDLATVLGAAAIGFTVAGPWGAAVAGGVGLLTTFGQAHQEQAALVAELTTAIDTQTGKIQENALAKSLAASGAFEDAGKLGIDPSTVLGAAQGRGHDRAVIEGVGNQPVKGPLPGTIAEAGILSKQGNAYDRLTDAVDKYADAGKRAEAAYRATAAAVGKMSPAKVNQVAAATRRIPKSVITKFSTPGAPQAVTKTAQVLRNTKATPKDIRLALTLAGWKTKDIEAVVTEVDKLRKKPTVTTTATVEDQATPKIGPLQKAIDDYVSTPAESTVTADGSQAKSEISSVRSELSSLNGTEAKTYITTIKRTRTGKSGGGRIGFAGGGKVPGTPPANPNEDNVYAGMVKGTEYRVRSGEWVINEQSSRTNDRLLAAINGGFNAQAALGLAGGGRVGVSDSAAGQTIVAHLADRGVHVRGDGLLELIDDRVYVTIGATDAHKRQAKARRKG